MSDPTMVEVLKGARELVADEDRWTQAALARDTDGMTVGPLDPSACCWCMVGAVLKASNVKVLVEGTPIDLALRDATGEFAFGDWNDTHSHTEVLAALDRAIEAAS